MREFAELPLAKADIAPLEARLSEGMPAAWKDFALCFYACLLGLGLSPDNAADFALSMVESMAKEFGGTTIYVPLGLSILYKQRDNKINTEFTGNNHRQLAQKFKITEMRIRQILNSRLSGPNGRKTGS